MAAQNETDRAIFGECGEPLGARNIRARVIDKKPAGHQKITSKQQSRTTVVKRDFRFVVPWCRDHIDCSITKIDLCATLGPISKRVVFSNALDIKSHYPRIGERRELGITGAMIKVPV